MKKQWTTPVDIRFNGMSFYMGSNVFDAYRTVGTITAVLHSLNADGTVTVMDSTDTEVYRVKWVKGKQVEENY